MNQLDLTKPGGFPLTQNDLKFQQDSILEAIKALASGFNLNNQAGVIILSGCEVSYVGLNTVISSGYIIWSGEVMFVATTTLVTSSNPILFDLVDNPDPVLDPTTFFVSGATHSVHRNRYAILTYTNSATTRPLLEANRVRNIFVGYNGADIWHQVGAIGEPQYLSGFGADPTNPVRFKKDATGQVHIYGALDLVSTFSPPYYAFVLPPQYRPPVDLTIASISTYAGVAQDALIRIAANGQVSVALIGASTLIGNTFYFAQTGYLTT